MQDAPDIDVTGLLNVKDKIGIIPQRPVPNIREIQFVCVTRRAAPWKLAEVLISLFERINEAMSSFRCMFV